MDSLWQLGSVIMAYALVYRTRALKAYISRVKFGTLQARTHLCVCPLDPLDLSELFVPTSPIGVTFHSPSRLHS